MSEGALLVKLNADEARLLTGAADSSQAARAVCSRGARLALVTLGPQGALLRGEAVADASGVPARVVHTTGAVGSPSIQLASGLTESG